MKTVDANWQKRVEKCMFVSQQNIIALSLKKEEERNMLFLNHVFMVATGLTVT